MSAARATDDNELYFAQLAVGQMQNLAYLIWGPKALPFPVPYGMPLEIGNLSLPMSYVWIVIAALVFMAIVIPVAVAVREVDPGGIGDPNWQNLHLRTLYQAGMGAVASAVRPPANSLLSRAPRSASSRSRAIELRFSSTTPARSTGRSRSSLPYPSTGSSTR